MNDLIEKIKTIFSQGWNTLKNGVDKGLIFIGNVLAVAAKHLIQWIRGITQDIFRLVEEFAKTVSKVTSRTVILAREISADLVEIIYTTFIEKKVTKDVIKSEESIIAEPPAWLRDKLKEANANGQSTITITNDILTYEITN